MSDRKKRRLASVCNKDKAIVMLITNLKKEPSQARRRR